MKEFGHLRRVRERRNTMKHQRERVTLLYLGWGMFLIGLAFAVFFGLAHYFLTVLFLGLACFSLLGMLSMVKPRKIYRGLQEFVWFLGLAILFLPQIAFWPWGVGGFLIICGISVLLGALAKPIIAGIKGIDLKGAASRATQQPQPTDEQPYQTYEQGYQPLPQAPGASREGGEVYSSAQQQPPYEQPQTQYPQEQETPLQQ
jgi:hypothetical protein